MRTVASQQPAIPQTPLRIVIDDERNLPVPNAVVARTSAEGLALLRHATETGTTIEQLWLDHDLGIVDGELDDIRVVLAWLEEQAFFNTGPEIELILVHTANPVGAQALTRGLSRFYNVRRVNLTELFS